ncbi:hypothetical protein COPCOM_01560 [Coprococcus comes ATCC 27758]|uniref:Uncharacterized protein n=1 Tax=Coprococcus comes ATCC 27758 TaxID=470146 RepID=C0B8T6_9FIRM|nr:hypothetical protein COPCOM_01560 [Coprococcus comes ATCC 27758]
MGFRLLRRYFLSLLSASLPHLSEGTDKSRASIKLNIHHFLYQPYYKIFIFARDNCYLYINFQSLSTTYHSQTFECATTKGVRDFRP